MIDSFISFYKNHSLCSLENPFLYMFDVFKEKIIIVLFEWKVKKIMKYKFNQNGSNSS